MGEGQNPSQVAETVEVLENRMRLAARFSAPAHATPNSAREAISVKSNRVEVQGDGSTSTADAFRSVRDGDAGKVRAAASPGDQDVTKSRPLLDSVPQHVAQIGSPTHAKPKGLLSGIMDNARFPSGGRDPWEPPPVAMKGRVQSFEETLAKGRTDQHIRAAEKSGQALMRSMETFMTGPGAGVLGKIEAAASTEPGGMQAVMSEMQPGGRYASLRSEFDSALQQDRAFAASFNAVEKTAGQYGQDRLTLAADFQARKLDVSQLDARFQQADAAIGEATEKIPGRGPGQTIMAEMAEKVSEMLSKAADRVRKVLGKENDAGPESSSPGPSP